MPMETEDGGEAPAETCSIFAYQTITKCSKADARDRMREAYDELVIEKKGSTHYLGTPDEEKYHCDVLERALKHFGVALARVKAPWAEIGITLL